MADPVNPTSTDKCSTCEKQVVKTFYKFHKSAANGDTTKRRRKYTDETGRLWHGTKCPDCAAQWRKDRAQSAADEIKNQLKAKLEE